MFKKIKYSYYKSIEDLPIWNFNNIIDKDDMRYLLKLEDYNNLPTKKLPPLDVIWMSIYDEYLNLFGINKKYETYLIRMKNLIILEFEKNIDKSLETVYDRAKLEMYDNIPKQDDKSFEKQLLAMIRYFKVTIDIKTISVKQFYTNMETIQKEIAQNRK